MKGWKTVIFGLAVAIGSPALTYLGGVDWGGLGLAPWLVSLIGVAIVGLRAVTNTPIGKS